ncbi:hypothetical protein HYALB_00000631 [Hymenoscyphus albidus]|uniref:Uncharacterized protein n=1 Tax=Hymenoscyphus albidus TaxID=595503 RepID=A0A9N9QDE8_9HELO|nr:hypothetical protein HYALB_00000631 [Hymenoscyphus albidus]
MPQPVSAVRLLESSWDEVEQSGNTSGPAVYCQRKAAPGKETVPRAAKKLHLVVDAFQISSIALHREGCNSAGGIEELPRECQGHHLEQFIAWKLGRMHRSVCVFG